MSLNCFVNLSNHASKNWEDAQLEAAEKYGRITDLPFPAVLPEAGEEDIEALAEQVFLQVLELKPAVVMCQGEYTLSFSIVRKLTEAGIPCLAACTKREVEERKEADGSVMKVSVFRFVRFRRFV